jgi:hypothetical protein
MEHKSAIDALTLKRQELIAERDQMLAKFNAEISGLETAIETLCGKTVWQQGDLELYDDENPNYIKSSIED